MSFYMHPPGEAGKPLCRVCGENVASHFDACLLLFRLDGDLALEGRYALCERCYSIVIKGEEPAESDLSAWPAVSLKRGQKALAESHEGCIVYEEDGSTSRLRSGELVPLDGRPPRQITEAHREAARHSAQPDNPPKFDA